MKKQLLIITMLLSGYVATSQAIEEKIVNFFPQIYRQNESVQVDMHSGLKSKSENSGVVGVRSTEYGHKVTAGRPGKTTINFFDEKGTKKYSKPVEVAAPVVKAIKSLTVGESKHAERSEGEKWTQINKGEPGAGEATFKHKRNNLVKVKGKKTGRVEAENQDGKQVAIWVKANKKPAAIK